MDPQVHFENRLTPIRMGGVVIPVTKPEWTGPAKEFKLVCPSGLEYPFVADGEWREVLTGYSWQEVKVIGLLNMADKSLIPQKVIPKGPSGDRDNVVKLPVWKQAGFARKMMNRVSELVLIPAAVCAVIF